MKGSTLAVIVVAGVAVVGYAFYATSTRRSRDTTAKSAKKQDPAADDGEDDRPAPVSPRPQRRQPGELDEPEPTPEKTAPGPKSKKTAPLPAPDLEGEMTLEEARKAFDDYIAEVDAEIDKRKLGTDEVSPDVYRDLKVKGHQAIDQILRRVDHTDPEAFAEVTEKQEIARAKLEELKPSG